MPAPEGPKLGERPPQRFARIASRDAVASLAGLFMDRLQEVAAADVDGDEAVIRVRDLQRIWGEVLNDFTTPVDEDTGA